MTMLAQKLDCRPIEGHDLPLGDLQKSLHSSALAKGHVLLEVQNIESTENEIKESEKILTMLMPNQLKANTMEFLEVSDIREIRTDPKPPKTQA